MSNEVITFGKEIAERLANYKIPEFVEAHNNEVAAFRKELKQKSFVSTTIHRPTEHIGPMGPLYRPDQGDNECYESRRHDKEPTAPTFQPFVRPDQEENGARQPERSLPTLKRSPCDVRPQRQQYSQFSSPSATRRRTSPYGGGAFAMAEGGWKGSYEQLKLPVLPRPGGAHAWVYDVSLALSVASTCSDLEEIAVFREILGPGELD